MPASLGGVAADTLSGGRAESPVPGAATGGGEVRGEMLPTSCLWVSLQAEQGTHTQPAPPVPCSVIGATRVCPCLDSSPWDRTGTSPKCCRRHEPSRASWRTQERPAKSALWLPVWESIWSQKPRVGVQPGPLLRRPWTGPRVFPHLAGGHAWLCAPPE